MTERLGGLTLFVLCGCSGYTPCGPDTEQVTHVRDGDSVVVGDGAVVRYLGIDTPEMDACYGDVAARANAALVLGADVGLADDARCEDIYGRRLAYVEVDGVDVGAWLLAHGYARLDVIPPNVARQESYAAHEAQARRAGRGLWDACP